MDDFLQNLKKVVRIVLYGLAMSQSDSRKAGPYQFPYNKLRYRASLKAVKYESMSLNRNHS